MTASTSRLAARTRAPGVVAIGRPVTGARMTTSCRGPPRRVEEHLAGRASPGLRGLDPGDRLPGRRPRRGGFHLANAGGRRAHCKEAKAERKREAMAAIQASLMLGGWLCPGCDKWNLSFRNLCYKCNGKRTAAGVLSRGVPDPRRDGQDRDESDSDDSVALDVRQEEQEELEATI